MSCPYAEEGRLTLVNLDKPDPANIIRVVIDEFYEPTMSCVMKVRYSDRNNGNRDAVLKLYDRRFSSRLRHFARDEASGEPNIWNESIEDDYVDYVRSGSAAQFVHDLRQMDTEKYGRASKWTKAQNEAWVHHSCEGYSNTEVKVYKALRERQGTLIPKLYHRVRLLKPSAMPSGAPLSEVKKQLIQVTGILIEYIPGFQLSKLHENLPNGHRLWQTIVDQAIELPNMFIDKSIVNEDVSSRNVLVTSDTSSASGFRTVMIDFGNCRFRGRHERDFGWGRANYEQAEKRHLGSDMQDILRNGARFESTCHKAKPWSAVLLSLAIWPPRGEWPWSGYGQ